MQIPVRVWRLLLAVLTLGVGLQGMPAFAAKSGAASSGPQAALPNARQVVETTSEGVGATASAALTRALANAVQQVTGVAASQVGDVQTLQERLTIINGDGKVGTLDRSLETTGRASTSGGGAIKSYQVLSQTQQGSIWRVRVKAKVYSTDANNPKREGLPRLAILTTTTSADDVSFRAVGSSALVLKRFRARIQESLLQTGAVRVLERDNFAASAYEQQVGGELRPENLAKLGQRYSADYVVVVDAQRLRLVDRGSQMYGTWIARPECELQAEIRVIDVATQELMGTTEVQRYFSQADIQAIAQRAGVDAATYPDRFEDALLRALAAHVQQAVVQMIVPGAVTRVQPMQPGSSAPAYSGPTDQPPAPSEKSFGW